MAQSTAVFQEALDAIQEFGSVRAAARETGIARTTLQYRASRGEAMGLVARDHPFHGELLTDIQRAHCDARGIPQGQLRHGWDKDAEMGRSYFFSIPRPEDDIETLGRAIEEAAAVLDGRGGAPEVVPEPIGDSMLVLAPADVHHGKLATAIETGDAYSTQIAEERTKVGVSTTIKMGLAVGAVEVIMVNTGNDSLHTDDGKSTTSGTGQDTDGTWFTMWQAAFQTWVWVIEEAARWAPVNVVFSPSNHDWRSGWSVNMALAAWFRDDPRVSFPQLLQAPRHRKYVVYGSSVLGFTHGDGAKDGDLAHLMAFETGRHFGDAMRGYWITGHLHHKAKKTVGIAPAQVEKDGIGVTVIRAGAEDLRRNVSVEVVRSPSGTDGWHDRNGYVGALKAVEAFLFHHRDGQIARFTKPFW